MPLLSVRCAPGWVNSLKTRWVISLKTGWVISMKILPSGWVISMKIDNEQQRLWEQAAHRASSSRGLTVSLDIELTGEWEHKLLCAYVGTVLCKDGGIPQEKQAQFSEFVRLNLLPSHISWLLSGRLVVAYDGTGRWTLRWEARSTDPFFSFDLDRSIVTFRDPTGGNCGASLVEAWKALMPEESVSALEAYLSGAGQEPPLPDLSSLPEKPPNWVRLEVLGELTGSLPIHRELEQRMGVTGSPPHIPQARVLFRRLLQHQVVFTDSVRGTPKRRFSPTTLAAESFDLSNGEQLAPYLFLKKNGSKPEREEFYKIQRFFGNLAGRDSVDVNISVPDPSEFVGATNAAEQSEPLELGLYVVRDRGDIPLEFSGAGIAEALFLSTIIESGQDRVLLLDEPALNLHPNVQRTIVNEIEAQEGKQFFAVTHSPWLIPAHVITKVSRFYLAGESTVRKSLPADIDPGELNRLQKELRRSADIAALLFSQGVILCEGETETGALPVWYEKGRGVSFEQAGVAVYWVGGDPGFQTYIRLLHSFDVPWAIVCDAKVIMYPPGQGTKDIAEQMKAAGLESVPDLVGLDLEKRCEVLRSYGVFTTAKAEDEEFQHLPDVARHLEEAGAEVGHRSKARKGRYIAEKYDCPGEILDVLNSVVEYLERASGGSVSV